MAMKEEAMTSNAYEYPDHLDAQTARADDQSYDNDHDQERDDDHTTSAEYDVLLQEAMECDLRETELTGCVHLGTDEHDVPIIVCIPRIGFDKHTVSEAEIKKMFLLFIKMADTLIRSPFSIVYAHDGAQYWLQRQPIVFRFYKLLPRKFKKNLESMYIIHPNVGIKSFFAFSRVFLSKKFYEKLTYVENIFDFQKIVSPMTLSLPYNYLLIEDEELALSSCGVTASLVDCYDPNLKSTRLLNSCVNFLRQFGLESTGLFRVSGDHNLLSLVKTRLEPSWTADKKQYLDCVIIGDKTYHETYGITYQTSANETPPDTPGGARRESVSSKISESDFQFLKRKDSTSNLSTTPSEKSPRPTSLFRMGGKLFQDGSSKENNKKGPGENRVRSLSSSGRSSLFSTTLATEKRTSMRFGQSTMRFFGQTTAGSPFAGKKERGLPIGVKSGVKSQSGATAEDMRDVASVSEMSCTSGDSTQASDDHDGKEKIVFLSSVVITDIDTVAQILKMILRDLPEPVITFATFESMMNICVQFESKEIAEDQWVIDVLSALSLMPLEHRETLSSLISFLAEVAALSEFNSMDVSNLASIFSPTVMRPPMDSESLQNAFQELRRSKNILKLLLTQATIANNAEKRGSKELPAIKDVKNDPSLSIENLHTNSILLNAATTVGSPKEDISRPGSPYKKPSPALYNINTTLPPLIPQKVSPKASSLSQSLPADAFITNRKRLHNRPMSVSLDSSMLSSFLATDTSSGCKLSPIREHESNPAFFSDMNNSFDGSLSSNNDGKEKSNGDKSRNSLGSAGMRSLPVKKINTRVRPMSTSAATSTSLSYFLKMFMSPRETADGSTGTAAAINAGHASPGGSRTIPPPVTRQTSVPPSIHRRAAPVISAKLSRP